MWKLCAYEWNSQDKAQGVREVSKFEYVFELPIDIELNNFEFNVFLKEKVPFYVFLPQYYKHITIIKKIMNVMLETFEC